MTRAWKPAAWPLSVKVVAGILLTSLAPLLISAWTNTQHGVEVLRETELRNLKQIAANVSGRIAQLLTDSRRLAAYVASEPAIVELLKKPDGVKAHSARARMQQLIAVNPDIDLAIVMDNVGDAVMATESNSVGRNYRFREYFVSAIQGRPFTTGIIIGTAIGGAGVYLSHPVQGPDGLIIGIIMLRVPAQAIHNIVEDERQVRDRTGFIVDADGVVIYHPDAQWKQKSLVPLDPATQKRIAQDRRFGRETIDSLDLKSLHDAVTGTKDAGSLVYAGRDGADQVAGYAPVRIHPWTVVVTAPESAFSAPLRDFFWRNVGMVALVGILFALLALGFARSLTQPLGRLTNSARALSAGRFDEAKTDIRRADEIGVLANTFNDMAVTLRDREHERDIFGRLVSPEVRDKLIKGELKLGGEQLRVAVLFSDIRGFTSISEATGPHDVVFMLNEYLTEMAEAVKPFDGYINNFIGDAIVVVFGAPTGGDSMEWRAVQAAFAMRERLAALNERRVARGDERIDNGIGIAAGRVIAGQMGSPERCIYTVIGDTVNVAARIESLTRDVEGHAVLVNEAIEKVVRERAVVVTDLGKHTLKGRKESVAVFAVDPKHG